jgi:hypothetical protein
MGNKISLENALYLADSHNRTHMSRSKIIELEDRTDKQDLSCKPVGLWYGTGASWLYWCGHEMPGWVGGYLYRVTLNTDYILRLTTPEAVLAFTDEYGQSTWGYRRNHIDSIDWPAVAEKYSGIEIAPYQHSLRMGDYTFWYYSWDVASGCVWDPYTAQVTVEKLAFLGGAPERRKSWIDYYGNKEGEQENDQSRADCTQSLGR